jgi:hypothetical protein
VGAAHQFQKLYKVTIKQNILEEIVSNEPEMRRIQISAMVRKAFKALDSAAGLSESDPPWLWKLKIKGKKALEEKDIERAFLESAKAESDGALFKKAVSAHASLLDDREIKAQIPKVEWLLLEYWVAKEKAPLFRSLCYYNDQALAKLVAFLLKLNPGSDKSIRKIWERLGLKKSRRLLFRDVKIIAGKPAMPVFYKVIQNPD